VLKEISEAKGGEKVPGRGELDGIETELAANADIGENIVNVEDARMREACSMDGGAVDFWLGLAGSNATGKNARLKMAEESEMGQGIFHVNGVRVGHEDEAAPAREASEK